MSGPIELVDAQPDWPAQYAEVAAELREVFATGEAAIEHIGSTAVPGLCAKPILDVLVGVADLDGIRDVIERLAQRGFRYKPEHEQVIPDRRYFSRPADARLAVHVHVVVERGRLWREHLAFRDALRADPTLAARYGSLKRELAGAHGNDRAGYTAAKAPFIAAVRSGG